MSGIEEIRGPGVPFDHRVSGKPTKKMTSKQKEIKEIGSDALGKRIEKAKSGHTGSTEPVGSHGPFGLKIPLGG